MSNWTERYFVHVNMKNVFSILILVAQIIYFQYKKNQKYKNQLILFIPPLIKKARLFCKFIKEKGQIEKGIFKVNLRDM